MDNFKNKKMSWEQIDRDLNLLKEFMDIYIQLIPQCYEFGGTKNSKRQLPDFDEFKKYYSDPRYSMVIPNFKDSIDVYEDSIAGISTKGLGSTNGIAFRNYNYYMSMKYFTGGNINGNYTIVNKSLNEKLLKCVN